MTGLELNNSEQYSNIPIIARLHNQNLTELPHDLYIDPDALQILLEIFEGPLDLLLYLIRRQNLDILTVPIKEITNQYISYINAMQVLNINLAAEYLVMAATLLTIKSRLLLPKQILDNADDIGNTADQNIDPRQELINQLLEYEKIKMAATQLSNMPQIDRDYQWINVLYKCSDVSDINGGIGELENTIEPIINLVDLHKAWQRVLQNTLLLNKEPQKIAKQELSVQEHMRLILNKLNLTNSSTSFSSLFEYTLGISYIIVHFIAILELSKDGLIKLFSEKNDIIITLAKPLH